jgi:hypothetical protein
MLIISAIGLTDDYFSTSPSQRQHLDDVMLIVNDEFNCTGRPLSSILTISPLPGLGHCATVDNICEHDARLGVDCQCKCDDGRKVFAGKRCEKLAKAKMFTDKSCGIRRIVDGTVGSISSPNSTLTYCQWLIQVIAFVLTGGGE